MPDFRGLFVYTITKGHQHEADGLFRYLRETMNSATINPKGKITISCIGGRTLRTASEHFTARSIVDFLHPHDHFTIIGIIKCNVKVIVVQIDGVDKCLNQPLLAITVCHIQRGYLL